MRNYLSSLGAIVSVAKAQASFSDAAYFALSAEEKQNQLWTQMMLDPTPNPYYSNTVEGA